MRAMARKETEKHGVLYLVLHREFFDAIASGTKKTEYRADTPYWRTRLENRTYSEIVFRNGYAKDAPVICVEWLGVRRRNGEFAIRLGEVKSIKNYRHSKR